MSVIVFACFIKRKRMRGKGKERVCFKKIAVRVFQRFTNSVPLCLSDNIVLTFFTPFLFGIYLVVFCFFKFCIACFV